MAKNRKTGGKNFHPGENGYQKTVPEDLRQARKLTKTEIELILYKYLDKPIGELMAEVKDPMKPTIEILVMSVLITAIKKGDHDRLNFVLDRLIGKVKDNVDHTIKLSFHEQCVEFIESIEAKYDRIEQKGEFVMPKKKGMATAKKPTKKMAKKKTK